MGDGVTKKRKRTVAEPPVDATALSKKAKKTKKPVPKVQAKDDSDDEDDDDDDVEDEEQDEKDEDSEDDEDKDEEESDAESAEDEENDDAADDTIGKLPTDEAPVLSLSSDSELFEQLKLSEKTMKAIGEMGFTKMTAIQKVVRYAQFRGKMEHRRERSDVLLSAKY